MADAVDDPRTPSIRLSRDEFRLLARAIAEVAGAESADDVLFRIGRRLGEAEALRLDPDAGRAVRMRAGLDRLGRLGLGTVQVDELEVDGDSCRVAGHVVDPLEAGLASRGGAPTGEACGLTVGFLTGLTAEVTGQDVVCSPFHCQSECSLCGCRFEIRPAHAGEVLEVGAEAPSGSARFFLGSLGRGIAEGDISLDALLEHTSDAIILLDLEDVVRFWNQGAEDLFQYPRADVVGRPAGFILPDDLREQGELGWIRERLAAGDTLRNYVTRRVRRDGTELSVSLTRMVLRDSRGSAIGSTAVIRDITEQKRTEEELGRARTLAMFGELASKIAHEVKNPLAGIYAAVQLLARDCDEDDPRREIFDDVSKEIHRMDETVQELLNFARPVPPRPRPTDLRSFVLDLLEALRHQPQLEPHRIEVAIQEELVVGCDTRLAGQILSNLVLNAGQAMERPGQIRISARPVDGMARVAVADTGPGIPSDQLENIFEPFFTTRTRGTGLGLCIARKNVEAHGGRLVVRSDPGNGAVFEFTLPLAEGPHPSSRGA